MTNMVIDLLPRDLGDGLLVRRTTALDVERVVELILRVFRDTEDEPPHSHLAAWTRDLASGRHPLSALDQGLVVEDRRAGRLAASMWLIPTVWTYGGIPFGVGRPELVASHPQYRGWGLVRALFDVFHAGSAAAGDLVQAITGIPYYYRQFNYEYALDLGSGRIIMFDDIPPLHEAEGESYVLQEVATADIPFVRMLYERDSARNLVSATIPARYWDWELAEANPASLKVWRMFLIVDRTGTRCGCVLGWPYRVRGGISVHTVVVADGVALHAVLRPVLRALRALAPTFGMEADDQPATRILLDLGAAHPLYAALGRSLAARCDPPGAWYVRVPDLPRFVRHIAPALEHSLAASALAGYTGELRLDFYRSGLHLRFENGRLITTEGWQRALSGTAPSAGFPPLVFLQLLFGRRSLQELRHMFPDVWAGDEGQVILEALFPPQRSHVLPLD